MRIILSFVLILFASDILYAQDTLYKADGSTHLVKIIEINETQVKFKKADNLTGPLYVLDKNAVVKIIYQNGQTELYSNLNWTRPLNAHKIDTFSRDFGRHFVSINLADFLFDCITVGYEYFFKSGYYSIKIPLSTGYYGLGLKTVTPSGNYYGERGYYEEAKTFSTGIEAYFYPTGQGRIRTFLGPSLHYGQFNFWDNNQTSGPYSNSYSKGKASFYSGTLVFGMLFQASKSFNFSLHLAGGITQSHIDIDAVSYRSSVLSSNELLLQAGFNVGYRFNTSSK